MSSSSALVSIIVPSYNHSPYLRTLVNSIMTQSYQNLELIVLDDGSKDNSPEVLKELQKDYQFKLILKNNEGLCETVNKGLALANGKYVVIFGSDDAMPGNRIQEQVDFLESHPDTDVVAGAVTYIDRYGEHLSTKVPKVLGQVTFPSMMNGNLILAPSAMIRKAIFEKVGTYNPKFLIEDYYLWLKILAYGGKIVNTDKVWADYRFDPADLKKRLPSYYKGTMQVLEEYAHTPEYPSAIAKAEFSYLMKLALFDSNLYRQQYRNKANLLAPQKRLTLIALNALPRTIKEHLIKKAFFPPKKKAQG